MNPYYDDQGNRTFSSKIEENGNTTVTVRADKVRRDGKWMWGTFIFSLTEKEKGDLKKALE